MPDTVKHSDLRIVFYDEGFIKLLGANGFILFTLKADGTPINVAIEPCRELTEQIEAASPHSFFFHDFRVFDGCILYNSEILFNK